MLLLQYITGTLGRNAFLCLLGALCSTYTYAQDDLYNTAVQKQQYNNTSTNSQKYIQQPSNQSYNDNVNSHDAYSYPANDQNPNALLQKSNNTGPIPYSTMPSYTDNTNQNSPYNYANNDDGANQNFNEEEVTNVNYPTYSVFYSPWFYPSIGIGVGWGGSVFGSIAFNWGLGLGYGWGWDPFYSGWGNFGYPYYPWHAYPYFGYGYRYPYRGYHYHNRPIIYERGYRGGRAAYYGGGSNFRRSTYTNYNRGGSIYNTVTPNANARTYYRGNTNYNMTNQERTSPWGGYRNDGRSSGTFGRGGGFSGMSENRGGGGGFSGTGGARGGGGFRR